MVMLERAAYTLNEAGRLLGGISRGHLYNMHDRGELRFVKLGRRTLVPADEIRRLLEPESSTSEPRTIE